MVFSLLELKGSSNQNVFNERNEIDQSNRMTKKPDHVNNLMKKTYISSISKKKVRQLEIKAKKLCKKLMAKQEANQNVV